VPAALEPAADAALLKKGEALFQTGNWSNNVPACTQCHGEAGQGIGAQFPAITPQSSAYIRNQLRDWKNGARRNDPISLMKSVADHLSDDDAAAVAAYLASRSAK
jgi:cytochrome c553